MKAMIFGLGRMGMRHFEALSLIVKNKIIGFDHNPTVRNAKKTEMIIYDDPVEAVEREQPHLVIVASNGPSHHENIQTALRSPNLKAILCEKPMAGSVQVARASYQLCLSRGVRLAINHWRRYHPWYQKLKQELDAIQLLGRPLSMTVTCGAGGLASVGVHHFDLARFFFRSELESILAFQKENGLPVTRGPQFEDPGLYGLVLFKNGERMFFDFSEDFGPPPVVEICGTHGRITIDEGSGRHTVACRPENQRPKSLRYYGEPLIESPLSTNFGVDLVSLSVLAIQNLLDDHSEILASAQDGIETIAMYSAARASAKECGIAIKFPIDSKIEECFYPIT